LPVRAALGQLNLSATALGQRTRPAFPQTVAEREAAISSRQLLQQPEKGQQGPADQQPADSGSGQDQGQEGEQEDRHAAPSR